MTLGAAMTGQTAPITFNTALPVAKEEFMLRQQFVIMQSGDDSSGANRDRNEKLSATALAYGINNRLALFGILPYRDISLAMDSTSQRVDRSSNGLGDIRLFGRYIFRQENKAGSTFRLAAFAGAKLPSGKNDQTDNLGTLPPSAQTGTGSWDVFGGVVFTRQTLNYQFDSQLSYRLNNKANDFELGDKLQLDGSLQKRVWPRELSSGVPGFLYAVLEANSIYQGKNKRNGDIDNNSGGTRLFVSPGIQYVTRRWIIESSIQLPLLQNLNGTALEGKYIAQAGVRVNF